MKIKIYSITSKPMTCLTMFYFVTSLARRLVELTTFQFAQFLCVCAFVFCVRKIFHFSHFFPTKCVYVIRISRRRDSEIVSDNLNIFWIIQEKLSAGNFIRETRKSVQESGSFENSPNFFQSISAISEQTTNKLRRIMFFFIGSSIFQPSISVHSHY